MLQKLMNDHLEVFIQGENHHSLKRWYHRLSQKLSITSLPGLAVYILIRGEKWLMLVNKFPDVAAGLAESDQDWRGATVLIDVSSR